PVSDAPAISSSVLPTDRLPRYQPTGEAAERWQEAIRALEREALSAVDADRRARLQAEAGRLCATTLQDGPRATALLGAALQAGLQDERMLKAYSDVAANEGDYERLWGLLLQRAERQTGANAAEALQDAVLVAQSHLPSQNDPETLVGLLERALAASPEDWFTLRLMHDLERRRQRWPALTEILKKMVALSSGPMRSRLLVERGRILERELGRPDEAAEDFDAALEAEPTSVEAFLAVERLALGREDAARLVSLYISEADRLVEGPDAAFWVVQAARASATIEGESAQTATLYTRATAMYGAQGGALRHEAQQFLARDDRWDDVAEALQEEAELLEDPQERAYTLYRLGRLHEERREDAESALEAYRATVSLDSAAAPALEAAVRLLAERGEWDEIQNLLHGALEDTADAAAVASLRFQIANLCEGPLEDLDQARAQYLAVLDGTPDDRTALEGLVRIAGLQRKWDDLSDAYQRRAGFETIPERKAQLLHQAATVGIEEDEQVELIDAALAVLPYHPPSVDSKVRLLRAAGDWAKLAEVLNAAATGPIIEDNAAALLRMGRILLERVGDVGQAAEALQRAVAIAPELSDLHDALRAIAERMEDREQIFELHRAQAARETDPRRRHWRLLVAAQAAERAENASPKEMLEAILEEVPDHAGALAALEERALSSSDLEAELKVYQRMAARSEGDAVLSAHIAAIAASIGDHSALDEAIEAVIGGEGSRPRLSIARLAERLGLWESALRLLDGIEGAAAANERARLLERYSGDPALAADAWRKRLESSPDDIVAASGLERTLRRQGAREGLAGAHTVLSHHSPDPHIRAFHALLAGHLLEAAGQADAAIGAYTVAFEHRRHAGKAFDALRRLHARRQDVDGLKALFSSLSAHAPDLLAQALDDAGAHDEAASRFAELIAGSEPSSGQAMAMRVRRECALQAGESWKGLFEALSDRLILITNEDERRSVESKRRWVLSSKLAETEEAWTFYQQLHEENPQDGEVLEALAAIASARGEVEKAVRFLQGLADGADNPEDAARYHRRIAEVHLRHGDREAATGAYEAALDLFPVDMESLSGLKQMATEDEDWQRLVGVLSREAASAPGLARIDCYRQIATLWEEKLQKPDIARESWQRVLQQAPGDPESLQRLVTLVRDAADWKAFVQYGQQLIQVLEGAERTELMTEVGKIYLQQLDNENEAVRYLDVASQEPDPSLEAGQLLERVYRGRGSWEQVVVVLVRQARATDDDAVALGILLKAAEERQETLQDRAGAAEIYEQVLQKDPDNPVALRFRGDFLYREGRLDEAIDIFARMEGHERDRDLDDFDVRIEVAMYFFRFAEALRIKARLDEAMDKYAGALECNPSHLPTLEAVGPIFMTRGKWDEAAKVYRQILQLTGGQGDPERIARTYTALGIVEHRLGKLDKAKKRFNRALELKNNDIGALKGIAGVLYDRNDWNNLLNVYNNIIYHTQEPHEVVEAYLTKGFVLDAKLSLPQKAEQHYKKSLDFDPAQPAAYLRLAELSLRKQDWPEASSLAQRGLAFEDVSDARLVGGLNLVKAIAHRACQDDEAAAEAYRSATSSDSELTDTIGRVIGTVEQMHEVLRRRLQERP
ncbi:MAG: tetratricopeptide repeat protein, partial [Myxococcota bacterium]